MWLTRDQCSACPLIPWALLGVTPECRAMSKLWVSLCMTLKQKIRQNTLCLFLGPSMVASRLMWGPREWLTPIYSSPQAPFHQFWLCLLSGSEHGAGSCVNAGIFNKALISVQTNILPQWLNPGLLPRLSCFSFFFRLFCFLLLLIPFSFFYLIWFWGHTWRGSGLTGSALRDLPWWVTGTLWGAENQTSCVQGSALLSLPYFFTFWMEKLRSPSLDSGGPSGRSILIL